MRPTIPELREWQPELIAAAGRMAHEAAEAIGAASQSAMRAHHEAVWSGQARRAADTRADAEGGNATTVRNLLYEVSSASIEAAADMGPARQFVLTTVDAAEAAGCIVTPDGGVIAPDEEREEAARTYSASISSGLVTLDAIDERHGARLEAARADLSNANSRMATGMSVQPVIWGTLGRAVIKQLLKKGSKNSKGGKSKGNGRGPKGKFNAPPNRVRGRDEYGGKTRGQEQGRRRSW